MGGEGGGVDETVEQQFSALPPAAHGQVFSPARLAPEAVAPAVPPLDLAGQGTPFAAAAAGPATSGLMGADIMAAFGAAQQLPLQTSPAPEPAAGGAMLPASAPQPPAAAPGKVRLKVAGASAHIGHAQAALEWQPQPQHPGSLPAVLLHTSEAPQVLPAGVPPAVVAAVPPPAPQAAAPAAKPFKLKLKVKPVQPPPQ